MPRYKQVPPLVAASIHTTASTICNALVQVSTKKQNNSDTHNFFCVIQDYISNLPISLQENLLQYILDFQGTSATVRCLALKAILNPDIKSLAVGIFPINYFKKVTHVIYYQGMCLESLDLRGIWLNGELSCELENILHCLKNLRNLHIPHMATDSVLKVIGQYNTLLQVLDIMGECTITEAGVESLCNAGQSIITHNLKFVLLGNSGGTEVAPRTVSILIKYLPNLQSLGSYPNVGKAFECLALDGISITTNLTYIHDSYTDLKRIHILVAAMPMLESIFIDHPIQGVIHEITRFPHLMKVKLVRFPTDEFLNLIAKIGKRITSLELMSGRGSVDFSYVSKQCPNLIEFIGNNMEGIRALDNIQLTHLKKIDLYHCNVSISLVKSLIGASPNIEKLSITDRLEIIDNDIIEIFTTQEFSELRYVWLSGASRLTSTSVQIFIECCPNLNTLGELSVWNVTQAEVNIFKEIMDKENLALKIIEYFR